MKIRTALATLLAALAAAGPAAAQPETDPSAAVADVRLVLNIPAGRIDLFRGEERLKSYPVSAGGAPRRRAGRAELTARPRPDLASAPPPPDLWRRPVRPTPGAVP